MGWWSTAPPSGPDTSHLSIHRQLLQDYNESAVFLAFHPSQLQQRQGAKLPLTVYESVLESENHDTGKDMQIDGEEPPSNIRFRELPYSVETGEAEMIGVDTIAKGSGTATRTETTTQVPASGSSKNVSRQKQKQKEGGQSTQAELSQEEEECMPVLFQVCHSLPPLTQEKVITNLNTRLNAIRTLESRIALIKSYVSSVSNTDASNDDPSAPKLSHTILRNINSLLSHLSILSPDEQSGFTSDFIAQSNDVLLVSLLGQMGEGVQAMRELGYKSAMIETARQASTGRKKSGLMQERFADEVYGPGMVPGPGAGSAMYS